MIPLPKKEMKLSLYNSITKQKELFEPREPGKVSLYVCGVTVYDECHIGHARTYLAFDIMVRYFQYCGYQVKYVRNITDIDDKIIQRAQKNGEEPAALVARYTSLMHIQLGLLGLLPPTIEPKATEAIQGMVNLIQKLIDKGFAYQGSQEDVYYRIDRFKQYGRLSGQNLDALQVGARVERDSDKENPLDFVLWKSAKPGEPAWPSPWGLGRPGWHIECSAMSLKELGPSFDIHGGGFDLRFPHHENEIAQSEAANGCQYARYWVHTGMVKVNSEKMSKSLGNFFTISEVLKQYDPEVVRYFLISSHYRSEVQYSDENLKQAGAALERLYSALYGLDLITLSVGEREEMEQSEYAIQFHQALQDDFNTAEAFAVLFKLAREVNCFKDSANLKEANRLGWLLKHLALDVLGILNRDPLVLGQFTDEDERLVARRDEARKHKDFALSDQLRSELESRGFEVLDTPFGTRCRRK